MEDDNHARRCRTPALKQTRGFWGDKSLLLQQLHGDSRGSYCEWKWSPISSLMREFSLFWFKCTTCLSTNGAGESCTHAGGWTNVIGGHIQHHNIQHVCQYNFAQLPNKGPKKSGTKNHQNIVWPINLITKATLLCPRMLTQLTLLFGPAIYRRCPSAIRLPRPGHGGLGWLLWICVNGKQSALFRWSNGLLWKGDWQVSTGRLKNDLHTAARCAWNLGRLIALFTCCFHYRWLYTSRNTCSVWLIGCKELNLSIINSLLKQRVCPTMLTKDQWKTNLNSSTHLRHYLGAKSLNLKHSAVHGIKETM